MNAGGSYTYQKRVYFDKRTEIYFLWKLLEQRRKRSSRLYPSWWRKEDLQENYYPLSLESFIIHNKSIHIKEIPSQIRLMTNIPFLHDMKDL